MDVVREGEKKKMIYSTKFSKGKFIFLALYLNNKKICM
jgi:hypothetical protein